MFFTTHEHVCFCTAHWLRLFWGKNCFPSHNSSAHKGSIKQSPRGEASKWSLSNSALPLLLIPKQPQTRCLRWVCAHPPCFSFHGRAFQQSMLAIWHTRRTQNPRNGRRGAAKLLTTKFLCLWNSNNFMLKMKLEEFEETQRVILQIPKNCLPEGIIWKFSNTKFVLQKILCCGINQSLLLLFFNKCLTYILILSMTKIKNIIIFIFYFI